MPGFGGIFIEVDVAVEMVIGDVGTVAAIGIQGPAWFPAGSSIVPAPSISGSGASIQARHQGVERGREMLPHADRARQHGTDGPR